MMLRALSQAERTLGGIEAVSMIRKGRVKRLAGSDATGRAKFVTSLFQIAARERAAGGLLRSNIIFATLPWLAVRRRGLVTLTTYAVAPEHRAFVDNPVENT